MAKNTFRSRGCVIDLRSQGGVAGLRIEAWDKDLIVDDLVGSAVTDEEGAFQISFDRSYFAELFFDRQPDLFFKVFQDDVLIRSTEDDVLWNLEASDIEVVIEVELRESEETEPDETDPVTKPDDGKPDANEPTAFHVQGQILQADGRPADHVMVRAFDKEMRSEEQLGEAITDDDGHYLIQYTAAQFQRAEKGSADLIVRALGNDGQVLAASPVLFNAVAEETIDLTLDGAVPPALSEYERLMNDLTPLMQGVPLTELTEEDINFLSGETGNDAMNVVYLVVAAQHSAKIDIPTAASYGFFRQNLPTELGALLLQKPDALRQALRAGVEQNIIPASIGAQIEKIIETLAQPAHLSQLDEHDEPPVLKVLATTTLSREKQAKFLSLGAQHDGAYKDFWQSLRQDPDFGAEPVRELQLTLQLGLLTGNHPPLIRELRKRESLNSLRDLAALEPSDWLTLVASAGVPDGVQGESGEEKSKNYVDGMMQLTESAFPTATIAAKLTRENLPESSDVISFFSNRPDFDFEGTRIDDYLSHHKESAFRDVRNREGLTNQLKGMQRLVHIAPRYEHMRTLLDEGLDSAYAISSFSKAAFVEEFGEKLGGDIQAELYSAKAVQVSESSTIMVTNVAQAVYDVAPWVIAKPPETIKRSVNFSNLFGSPSLCTCEHCASVYSPAAYLVDLLQFLNPGPEKKDANGREVLEPKKKPLHALRLRRPDIEHIQLSCENTETLLPYIDLVNEILEYYIAHDGELRGNLAKNTDISAKELRVNPQHTNEHAYEILKRSIYPLSMPFNRSLEVARAYLEHLGSSRAEVMRVFQTDGAPSDEAIAIEYLKISARERDILIGNTTDEVWKFYGYSDEDGWLDDLAQVPNFLSKTGITYADLTELLKTRFVNADHSVEVKTGDSPCDLNTMTIEPLTPPLAQKMHRFIRLWRKLGWTIEELDQALSALKAADVNAQFLQMLPEVKQLRTDLDLPLDVLLSLWSNIETSGDNSLYRRLFLNRTVLNPPDGAFTLDPTDLSTIIGDGQSVLTLTAHAPALLAAFGISAADLNLLRADLELAADDAELNLENLSALYRHSVLANALGLNIADVIALKTLSGIDPFDSPRQTKFFADVARKVRQSAFSLAQLDYLYRHLTPTPNNFAAKPARLLVLAKNWRDGLTQIAADNAIADDYTGEFARSKLAALFESAVVDQVIQMVTGDAVYSASLDSLPTSFIFPAKTVKKASYDAPAQMLRFTGPMTTVEKDLLLNASAAVNYRKAVSAIFQQPRDLIANTLDGFLDPHEAVTTLLETQALAPEGKPQVIADKFQFLLKELMPYLRDQLSHSLVKQTLADELELNVDMSALLLETPEFFPSRTDPQQAAIKDFLALRTTGLTGSYFKSADLTGASTVRIDARLDFDGHGATAETNFLPNSGSARWTGMLLAPNNDSYTLAVRSNAGVRLWLGHDQPPVIDAPQNTLLTELSGAPVALKASELYELQIEVVGLDQAAVVELSWSGATTPKDLVPSANLYPANVFDTFTAAFTLLQKTAMLVKGFSLSAGEVRYLSSHAADFDNLALGNLPLERYDQVDQDAPGHFRQWRRLHDFTNLRSGLPQSDTSLVGMFGAISSVARLKVVQLGSGGAVVIALQRLLNAAGGQPVLRADGVFDSRTRKAVVAFQQSQGLPGDGIVNNTTWTALKAATPNLWRHVMTRAAREQKLVNISGWDAATLDVLITKMNLEEDDFKNEIALIRLQTCIALIKRLGVAADQLFDWAATSPKMKQANDITKTVKARYNDETWLSVGKALNDSVRERLRDALIAYVLTEPNIKEKGITDSNQLFEYFLIDVNMDACMMTSRIKQAISSVQLFTQRCLMNLEQPVKPSAIDEDQWDWMKNYRVWEANRKVFLYPENWIEPELRDGKSPFFKELETQLLQNDITEETAEDAFLSYLEKLEVVARLEICGMYTQKATETEGAIVHVFGRTHHAPHIYYYRQLADGVWTPWEKVDMDIEGDHLIPIVYNRRLYLFWPHFEEKPDAVQELGAPYVQSQEHWRWVLDEPKRNADYAVWKAAHNTWQMVHDMWTSLETAFRSAKIAEPLIKNERRTFAKRLSMLDEPEPEEPTAPEEPPYSIPPALTHREIKLAWSEYKNGRWAPKQTSNDFVNSPSLKSTFYNFAHTLGATPDGMKLLVDFVKAEKGYHLATPETIVSTYLPSERDHFFHTEITGDDLLISVYRRFSNIYSVLGVQSAPQKGYEKLGHFYLSCGAKVKAQSEFTVLNFESLLRPDETTNSFMSFEQDGSGKLSVTPHGTLLEILDAIPDSASLLHEHQFGNNFALPGQSFFYQDALKTYFAHLQLLPRVEALVDGDKVTPLLLNYGVQALPVGAFRKKSVRFTPPKRMLLTGAPATRAPVAAILLASNAIVESPMTLLLKLFTCDIRFETFFHPHVCEFLKALYRDGIPGLLKRKLQLTDNDIKNKKTENVFLTLYKPNPDIVDTITIPRENVDFDGGAYALYNWELFFHIPMLIAASLSRNQQFEDARSWFHYIFNPTTSSKVEAPQRYWNTLPFFNNSHPENDQIQQLLSSLDSNDPAIQPLRERVERQIEEWRENPFNPHLIARLRITAYQKNVVMRYIDNLINWGDQLFSRDTIESINEATLLYVLAHNILGARPEIIPSTTKVAPKTYSQIKKSLDDFSNTVISFENERPHSNLPPKLSYPPKNNKFSWSKPAQAATATVKSIGRTFYFCTPRNDELLAYWDKVADRLFKIRHCMNIEGLVRELPLFEPPIDPALLVRATAMGLDLSSVLNDINSPQPAYRFSYMLQKALELCGELKSLGGALLSALEKKDAEKLSGLRADHEIALLKAVREVKKQQIEEAMGALEGLKKSKTTIETRRDYYRDIRRISAHEQEHMDKLEKAHVLSEVSQGISSGASLAHIIPNWRAGTSGMFGSPVATVSFGGTHLGSALQAAATNIAMIGAQYTHQGTMASIMGGHERRWDEWKQQEKLANKELAQIDKQIAAAEIRVAIAQKEKENQELQIENSQAIERFLRGKYTNEELYNWMLSQVSAVFFQSYKLAYDIAKRAEKAYRFERGLTSSSFIQFGHWDSLRKGLLSGERLHLDLKRMEMAYLDQNKREYEITKHVSLVMNDPLALIALKETGQCEIELPEALFDADYPGHYMRRIKSVSLTIPCVVGPYTSINCTLTLLNNKTRIKSVPTEPYSERLDDVDERFVTNFAALQSIATSHAQNDNGMFELNFRDERYLPFEGAGAISRWRIDLPTETNAFDFNTISDIVVQIKYTAREGGNALKTAAAAALNKLLEDVKNAPLARLFRLKHEFPTDWHRFLHPSDLNATSQTLTMKLGHDRFPFQFRGKTIKFSQVDLFLSFKNPRDNDTYRSGNKLKVTLTSGSQAPSEDLVSDSAELMPHASLLFTTPASVTESLTLAVEETNITVIESSLQQTVGPAGSTRQRLNGDRIDDIFLVCHYSISNK